MDPGKIAISPQCVHTVPCHGRRGSSSKSSLWDLEMMLCGPIVDHGAAVLRADCRPRAKLLLPLFSSRGAAAPGCARAAARARPRARPWVLTSQCRCLFTRKRLHSVVQRLSTRSGPAVASLLSLYPTRQVDRTGTVTAQHYPGLAETPSFKLLRKSVAASDCGRDQTEAAVPAPPEALRW